MIFIYPKNQQLFLLKILFVSIQKLNKYNFKTTVWSLQRWLQ